MLGYGEPDFINLCSVWTGVSLNLILLNNDDTWDHFSTLKNDLGLFVNIEFWSANHEKLSLAALNNGHDNILMGFYQNLKFKKNSPSH